MPTVKCKDCGFFTIHAFDSDALLILDDRYRESGANKQSPNNPNRNLYVGQPFCAERKHPIHEEFANASPNRLEIIHVGHAGRECDGFIPFQAGMTPQEHRAINIVQEIESRNLRAREEDIARNEQWKRDEREQREGFEKAINARHAEQLQWQKQVEQNVDRRFGLAEQNTESRHGRSIGFAFIGILLTAGLAGGGGFALVQWFLHKLFG